MPVSGNHRSIIQLVCGDVARFDEAEVAASFGTKDDFCHNLKASLIVWGRGFCQNFCHIFCISKAFGSPMDLLLVAFLWERVSLISIVGDW